MATSRHTDYRVTFAVLALGAMSFALLQSMVGPALPELQQSVHTSASASSWVFTGFLLGASIAPPILGRLGDIHGKARLLVLVLVLLSLGTLISALSTSLAPMLIGRVMQGVAAGIFPLSYGIIRDEFPRERVAASVGVMAALLAVGGGAGVVIAGPVVHHFSIHAIFWMPLIPIMIATVLAQLVVPESPVRSPSRVNWRAACFMGAGLALVLFAVTNATRWHWLSAKTLGLLAIGIGSLVIWVRTEIRADVPLVDMRMMRIRGVWTTNAVGICIGFGMYGFVFLLSQFLETPRSHGFGFGATATGVGLFMLPATIASLVAASQAGRLERRHGSKPPLIAGAACCAGCYLALTFAHDSAWQIYGACVLLGTGVGLAFAAMTNLIIQNVGPETTGVATGVNSVVRTIGGASGVAVAASVLAGTSGSDLLPGEHGYTVAFAVAGAVALVGLALAFAVPQRHPEDAFEPHRVGDLAEATP